MRELSAYQYTSFWLAKTYFVQGSTLKLQSTADRVLNCVSLRWRLLIVPGENKYGTLQTHWNCQITKLSSSRDTAQNIFDKSKNPTCEDPSEFGSILTHAFLDKRKKVRCGDR